YRTGDFARYLPDGSIEFIGRLDRQVKIRGFRIELQEIEALLSQHPGVSKNVVIVKQSENGDKHLVSYFVRAPRAGATSEALRRFCARSYPTTWSRLLSSSWIHC